MATDQNTTTCYCFCLVACHQWVVYVWGFRLRGTRAGSARVTQYVGQKAHMANTEDLNPRGWRGREGALISAMIDDWVVVGMRLWRPGPCDTHRSIPRCSDLYRSIAEQESGRCVFLLTYVFSLLLKPDAWVHGAFGQLCIVQMYHCHVPWCWC